MPVVINGTTGINTPGVVNTAAETIATTLAVTGVTTVQAGTAALPALTTTGDTNTGIFFPAADQVATTVGGTQGMRLTPTGLGIGTSSPDARLTIQSGGDTELSLKDFGGTTRAYIGTAGAFGSAPTGALRLRSDQGGIVFGFAGSEQMRIDSSGNVGIGTTSPAVKLHVQNGTIRAKQTATADATLIHATNSGGNDISFWKQGSTATAYGVIAAENGALFGSSGDLCIVNDASSKNIIFANNGAALERMRIDSSGGLRIKTTTNIFNSAASEALSVDNGTLGQAAAFSTNASGGFPVLYLRHQQTGGQSQIIFNSSGGAVGSITTTASTTAYNTSSDYRLKEAIAPMAGALAKVAALKPCTYKWKVDGSDGQGFIAHELSEVCPDAVTGEKDGEQMQGVDYGRLTPILTAALQEAIAKIETLEARLAVLEAK